MVVHVLAPGSSGSRPWQIAGGLVDDATIVLLALGLRQAGSDPRRVSWYALSPLPVIEFAGNGHVDGLALLLLVAAVMALRRERRGLAGALVGLATMVKLYPAIAVVAWWRRGRWRLALAAAAVVGLAEAPHLLVVGTKVLGYLPGYLQRGALHERRSVRASRNLRVAEPGHHGRGCGVGGGRHPRRGALPCGPGSCAGRSARRSHPGDDACPTVVRRGRRRTGCLGREPVVDAARSGCGALLRSRRPRRSPSGCGGADRLWVGLGIDRGCRTQQVRPR